MPCIGSVTFQTTYEGRKTDVLALVTSALKNEILLSWRTLQRLGVISEDFPHATPQVHVKAVDAIGPITTNEVDASEDKQHEKKKMIQETSTDMVKSLTSAGCPPLTNIVNKLTEAVEAMKEEYQSVFEVGETLDVMAGGPMKIKLKDNIPIKPLHLNTPRKTPYAYQGSAKAKLDLMVKLGILEKVEDVSDWCNPMSFVPKPDGDVRPVVDLIHLNKYVERPVHPFPTPKDIIAQIHVTSQCLTQDMATAK